MRGIVDGSIQKEVVVLCCGGFSSSGNCDAFGHASVCLRMSCDADGHVRGARRSFALPHVT